MSRKGRKPWQEKSYREARERLEKTLVQAVNGMTKTQLQMETGLSRPTIDKHLRVLMALDVPTSKKPGLKRKKVERSGRLFFWKTNYLNQLERYRLVIDHLDERVKADAVFKTLLEVRYPTLGPPWTTKKLHFFAVGSGANIAYAGYRRRKKTKKRCVG